MNEILNNNLKFIREYNQDLAQKIADINSLTKQYDLIKTKADEHNLAINFVCVHSQDNAQEEAKQIYCQLPHNDDNSVHIIYGLGLGYLFEEIAKNAKGKVILLEPDLETLRTVFEIVDFSNVLKRRTLRIVTNSTELKSVFFDFYKPKNKISFSFLEYYRQTYQKDINKFIEEIKIYQGIIDVSYNMLDKKSFTYLKSLFDRFETKLSLPYLSILQNKFENKPAIIVSAGASLHKNLELLKQYQDNAIIFSVGTAYKALVKNGIKPDFLNIIEMFNVSNQIDGEDLSDTNLIIETTANSYLYNYNYKNIFLYASTLNLVNRWFSDIIDEKFKDYQTKGTVSYNSLFSAYLLGCNPIIMLGQDLAYVDNRCYSKDSPYSSLVCRYNEQKKKTEIVSENYEELKACFAKNQNFTEKEKTDTVNYRIILLNRNLTSILGQDGKPVFTDKAFVLFVEYFKEFAQMFRGDKTFINSSTGGAEISGFDNVPFEEVCQKYLTEKIDINDILKAQVDEFKPSKDIPQKLKHDELLFEKVVPLLKEGLDYTKKLILKLENAINFNEELNSLIKKSIEAYIKINMDFYFKSQLIMGILYTEELAVANCLQANQKVEMENLKKIALTLENYFENGFQKADFALTKLREINESINSKS